MNSQPPSILYLRSNPWFRVIAGGSVAHTQGVINSFRELGYSVAALSSDELPGAKPNSVEIVRPLLWAPMLAELCTIPYGWQFAYQARRSFARKEFLFAYHRYTVHHLVGVAIARGLGIPLVLEYNGPEAWMARAWGGKRLLLEGRAQRVERDNLAAAALVVVGSDAAKDIVLGYGVTDLGRVLVNPNGVDTTRYSPDIGGKGVRERLGFGDRTIIGFIGTFHRWHGAEILAAAFVELAARQQRSGAPLPLLLMIGDGPHRSAAEQLIANAGLMEHARFTGLIPQSQGPEYLAACDVLVSPQVPNPDGSPFFGSPTKLFEYLAMGKAVVASRLDQIGQLLRHEENSLLVSPGDAGELSHALERAINDRDLRARLGSAGRKRALEEFSWIAHSTRILERLQQLHPTLKLQPPRPGLD